MEKEEVKQMDRNEATSVIQRFLTCMDICRDVCCGYCKTCRYNTEYDEITEALKLAIKAFAKDINVPTKEIIRCKDCKFYGRADKRRFYRGSDCLNKRIDTIVPDRDFCSRAEKRGEAE